MSSIFKDRSLTTVHTVYLEHKKVMIFTTVELFYKHLKHNSLMYDMVALKKDLVWNPHVMLNCSEGWS